MMRVIICLSVCAYASSGIAQSSDSVTGSTKDQVTPQRTVLDQGEQRRKVLVTMLSQEIDEIVSEARQQVGSDPQAVAQDISLALRTVERAPELRDGERAELAGKLKTVLREVTSAAGDAKEWRLVVNRANYPGTFNFRVESYVDEHGTEHPVDWKWAIPERENTSTDTHTLRMKGIKWRAQKVNFTLETADGATSWETNEGSLLANGLKLNILPTMMPRRRATLTATPTQNAAPSSGFQPGQNIDVAYSYPYDGILIDGITKFVFTVRPVTVSDDQSQVLVRLMGISRYWKNKLEERNISSMPVKDRRKYKMYNSPPTWGESVSIGDTAWIDATKLQRGWDTAGSVTETGKAELMAVGAVATAVVVNKLVDKSESPRPAADETRSAVPKRNEETTVFAPGTLVCNRSIIYQAWVGRVVSTDDGTSYRVRITYPPSRKDQIVDLPANKLKVARFISVDAMRHGAKSE